MAFDAHAGKEHVEVEGDHLLEGNGGVDRRGIVVAEVGGKGDEAGQILLGNLHAGELALVRFGITDHSSNVEAEIAHERERVSRVHSQRGQHRKNRAAETVVHPLALFVVQLFVIQQLNPVIQQSRLEMTAVVLLLLLQQGDEAFSDGEQLLERCLPVFARRGDASFHLGLQGRDAHHEELVEVVAEDGAELGLIQQRGAGIERLRQNALVERDPAQFPVDVAVRAQNVGAHELIGQAKPGSPET